MIHVAEPEPDFVGYSVGPQAIRDNVSKHYHKEHQQLSEIAQILIDAGVKTILLLIQEATVDSIINEAEKIDADMIVIGFHRHGKLKHIIKGNIHKSILSKSPRHVLIVPEST